MSIKLTPDIYSKGLKWNLRRENQIDTFTFSLYYFNEVATNLDSRTITSVVYKNQTVSLPLSDNNHTAEFSSDCHAMVGKGYTSVYENGPYVMAKGFVMIYFASFTFNLTLSEPMNSLNVQLILNGVTKVAQTKSWSSYFNPEDKNKNSQDIVSFVDSNLDHQDNFSGDSAYVTYSQYEFSGNPFIKKLVPANNDKDHPNYPDPSYIITKWTPSAVHATGTCAQDPLWTHTSWNDNNPSQNTLNNNAAGTEKMWPAELTGALWPTYQRISLLKRNAKVITRNVTKINDYQYRITCWVPIKYIYMAAARANHYAGSIGPIPYEGEELTGALAFYDMISSITCSTVGYKYADSYQEYSYSLNEDGDAVTTEAKNTSALKIPQNNFIKSDTRIAGTLWENYWPKKILDAYKRGRYVVSCIVPADWALDNNIQVNSKLNIVLPNNQYIYQIKNRSEGYGIERDGKSITARVLGRQYIFDKASMMRINTWIIEGRNITGGFWFYDGQTQRLLREPSSITASDFAGLTKIVCIAEGDTQTASDLNLPHDGYLYLFEQNELGEDVIVFSISTQMLENANNVSGYGPNITAMFAFIMNEHVIINSQYNEALNKCCTNGAYIEKYYWNVEKGISQFSVKNILKRFKDNEFVYELVMVEEALEEQSIRLIYYEEPITSIDQNVEYFFEPPISINPNIARIDMRANNIHIRLRASNSLEVIRDYWVGRIVINKSDNNLTTYKWVSGSTFQTYERFDLTELASQDYIVTLELGQALQTQYNATEIYKNLGGYVEED